MEKKIAIQGHGVSSRLANFSSNWCFSLMTTPIRTCAAVALTGNHVAILLHADCSTDVLAVVRELQEQVGKDRLQLMYICHERCAAYWTRKIGKPPTETITELTGCFVELCSTSPYRISDSEFYRAPPSVFRISEQDPECLILYYHLDQKDLQAVKDLHILYCSITVTAESIRMGPVLLDTSKHLAETFSAAQIKFSTLRVLTDGSIDWTKCLTLFLNVLAGNFIMQAISPEKDLHQRVTKDERGMTLLRACETNCLIKTECQFYLRKVKRYYLSVKDINFNDITVIDFPDITQYIL